MKDLILQCVIRISGRFCVTCPAVFVNQSTSTVALAQLVSKQETEDGNVVESYKHI